MIAAVCAALALAIPCTTFAEAVVPDAPSSDETAELFAAAQKAYDELNYEKCTSILSEIEKKTNLKTWEKVSIYKYRAFIHINTENDILARDAVISIYRLEPAFVLPDSEPPKIQKVFAEVKKEFAPRKTRKVTPAPEAKPVIIATRPPEPLPVKADVAKKAAPVDGRPNAFVRFWPSWTGLASGVALLTPGVFLGATATADRQKILDAPRDAAGRVVGITKAEAQAMQDDANGKALLGNILMGAGAAVAVTGAVLFLFYDDGWHGWRGFEFSLGPSVEGAAVGMRTTW